MTIDHSEKVTEREDLDTFQTNSMELNSLRDTSIGFERSQILIIIFSALGLYFLVFGIIELVTNFSQMQSKIKLECQNFTCQGYTEKLSFPENKKIFIYLEISQANFAQNDYYRTIRSRQNFNCRNFERSNSDLYKTTSITGQALNADAAAIPCGYYESFYPEGTFQIKNNQTSEMLTVTQAKISQLQGFNHYWSIQGQDSKKWANTSSERFKVWQLSNIPQGRKIKKLWGIIDNIQPDTYQITMEMANPLISAEFLILLTDNGSLGGLNTELTIICFLQAFIMGFFAVLVFLLSQKKQNIEKESSDNQSAEQTRIYLNKADQYKPAKIVNFQNSK